MIDDAADGRQSETSRGANQLRFCSALQPAMQLQVLFNECERTGWSIPLGESYHTGGEDWPDAYRHAPLNPQDAEACVVVFWHIEWNEPAFQPYNGLLFGVPNAVTSFNRYAKLCEAVTRRLLIILYYMYFDDASIQDWASTEGRGQLAVRQLNELLGTFFAPLKQQDMSVRGDSLVWSMTSPA